jgi:hypothetical protein
MHLLLMLCGVAVCHRKRKTTCQGDVGKKNTFRFKSPMGDRYRGPFHELTISKKYILLCKLLAEEMDKVRYTY